MIVSFLGRVDDGLITSIAIDLRWDNFIEDGRNPVQSRFLSNQSRALAGNSSWLVTYDVLEKRKQKGADAMSMATSSTQLS